MLKTIRPKQTAQRSFKHGKGFSSTKQQVFKEVEFIVTYPRHIRILPGSPNWYGISWCLFLDYSNSSYPRCNGQACFLPLRAYSNDIHICASCRKNKIRSYNTYNIVRTCWRNSCVHGHCPLPRLDVRYTHVLLASLWSIASLCSFCLVARNRLGMNLLRYRFFRFLFLGVSFRFF